MYRAKKQTRSFDLDNTEDLRDYDAILNDPMCKIIRERQIKKTNCEYDEGKLVGRDERIHLIVTWEEKEAL